MGHMEEITQQLLNRLQTDPNFRQRMLDDPMQTAQAEGFPLSLLSTAAFLGLRQSTEEPAGGKPLPSDQPTGKPWIPEEPQEPAVSESPRCTSPSCEAPEGHGESDVVDSLTCDNPERTEEPDVTESVACGIPEELPDEIIPAASPGCASPGCGDPDEPVISATPSCGGDEEMADGVDSSATPGCASPGCGGDEEMADGVDSSATPGCASPGCGEGAPEDVANDKGHGASAGCYQSPEELPKPEEGAGPDRTKDIP